MEGKQQAPNRILEFTESELASFRKKAEAFRATLNDREQLILDIVPGGGESEAMTGWLPDNHGARKIDRTHIRNGDGSITTCPPGYRAALVGGVWVCTNAPIW